MLTCRLSKIGGEPQDIRRVWQTSFPSLQLIITSAWTIGEIHGVVPWQHVFMFGGQ